MSTSLSQLVFNENDVSWHHTLVAAIIIVLGFIGISWNLLAMWIVVKNPLLKNSFGLLSFSHSIANTGVLIVFVVWSGPLTIIEDDSFSTSRLGRHIGQAAIFFWDACVYSHLAISINRLITISSPHKCDILLSKRNTVAMLVVVWSLATLHVIPYFWVDDCFIEYTPSSWTWDFASTECGSIISTYFDYYTGVSVFAIILCLDLTTLYKIRANNKLVLRLTEHGHSSNALHNARTKTEIRFFLQTCVQDGLFFYELLNFYFFSTLNSNPLYTYFTSSFAWEICHALDGLVVVLFQWRSYSHSRSTPTVIHGHTLTLHNIHHDDHVYPLETHHM